MTVATLSLPHCSSYLSEQENMRQMWQTPKGTLKPIQTTSIHHRSSSEDSDFLRCAPLRSKDRHGRTYYANRETGQVQWLPPPKVRKNAEEKLGDMGEGTGMQPRRWFNHVIIF